MWSCCSVVVGSYICFFLFSHYNFSSHRCPPSLILTGRSCSQQVTQRWRWWCSLWRASGQTVGTAIPETGTYVYILYISNIPYKHKTGESKDCSTVSLANQNRSHTKQNFGDSGKKKKSPILHEKNLFSRFRLRVSIEWIQGLEHEFE